MKLPASYYNTLSFIGSIVAGISLLLIIFLFAVTFFFDQGSSYLGLFIYIVLPALLVIGLLLIPIGMSIKIRRARKNEEQMNKRWLVLDLNNKRHRNASLIFVIGTIVFLFLTGIGSYEMFHYTESVEFCGTLCHKVMKPEYVAFQKSPHANVACVECHVGPGADWYVRSKLSGLYQVYSVIAKKYPQPIPTPVENLRPARETCEKCHWPQKFYAHQLINEKHYLSDSANTEWNINLRMKIGAEHSALGNTEGIHWHINPDIKIEYIASNHDRTVIPFVRYINTKTGDTTIYEDEYEKLSTEAMDTLETRTMDCMDCHNRPSHNYLVPQHYIDEAIASGNIPKKLPEIKRLSMEILANEFDSTHLALEYIENQVWDFYMGNYPDFTKSNEQQIKKAIGGIKKGFSENVFPEMKVTWRVYPDHIGHIEYNGCFRCHNDTHSSKSGKTISKDCNLCHTILQQGKPDGRMVARFNESLEFKHPENIDGMWKESLCSDCHSYLY